MPIQRSRQRAERRRQRRARRRIIVNGVDDQHRRVTMTIPIYQLITPGGDTQVVFNFEYRIPIIGTR